jgi:hypothetical protein
MKKFIYFFFLTILPSVSLAQTIEGYVQVRGLGQTSCGEYIGWVDTGNRAQQDLVIQWVWGFTTAYQMRGSFARTHSTPKQGNIRTPDIETTNLYLRKYCSNNPLSSILNGSVALIKELGGITAEK